MPCVASMPCMASAAEHDTEICTGIGSFATPSPERAIATAFYAPASAGAHRPIGGATLAQWSVEGGGVLQRRGRDSNSRYANQTHNGFQDRRIQPLCHPSGEPDATRLVRQKRSRARNRRKRSADTAMCHDPVHVESKRSRAHRRRPAVAAARPCPEQPLNWPDLQERWPRG